MKDLAKGMSHLSFTITYLCISSPLLWHLSWGFAQWSFCSAFFPIAPPAALSLHPSCCVLLTPEAFVSFDTSSSSPLPYQALCSFHLLHQSSFCLPFPLYHTVFPPHLILHFLPSPILTLYLFISYCFFWLTFLLRNSLSFSLPVSFCVIFNSFFVSFSQFLMNHPRFPSPAPILHEFSSSLYKLTSCISLNSVHLFLSLFLSVAVHL